MHRFWLHRALAFLAGCVAASVAGLTAGCGAPDVVSRTDTYHGAVHAVVGGTGEPSRYAARERSYPRLRERRLEVEEERIGLMEFLSLQGCRLGELAGHRNSQLGRVMVGTRRLAYEIDVLATGEDCLPELELEQRLKLGALLERKRRALPRHLWNALWTDSELDPYLSREAPPSPDDWDAFGTWALADLERALGTLGSVDDARAIENALADLRHAAPAGGLLRALDEVGHHLEAVAILLETHDASECRGATRRLAHLFRATYLPLQPELTNLDRRGQDVIRALGSVYSLSAAGVQAPDAMERYRRERLALDGENALFERYRRAVVRHSRAWPPALEACGLLPRPEPDDVRTVMRRGPLDS